MYDTLSRSLIHPFKEALTQGLDMDHFKDFRDVHFFYGTEQQDHKEQIISLFVPFVAYLPVKYRKH